MELTITKKYLPPKVGMCSCVGILDTNFPLEFGNYCSINNGPYLCNMWAENLREWSRRNPSISEIEITVVKHCNRAIGFVSDERLKEWCNSKTCVTGMGWPSVTAMRAVCDSLGLEYATVCGCEKDTDRPRITQSWSKDKVGTNNCSSCGRSWSIKE